MRIGIDGRALQGSRTGVGRYVYELCRELDKAFPHSKFFIYSHEPIEMPVLSDRWILRLDEFPFAKHIKSVLWLKYRCWRLCKKDNLDVFWGAATFLPHLTSTVRTVITIYDLNFKIVPETMSFTHRWAFELFFKRDVANADVVVTISKGSSDRLKKLFGRVADAIVYPAVGTGFKQQSGEKVQKVLSQYALERPYLLTVATWEPRKNIELLIRTFLKMKRDGLLDEHKLVLVGGRGWKDRRIADLISGNNSVIPIGYVSDKQLAPLYSGAEMFVFPSIYEGFGMPVLEAIACGTKVIASEIPELREAGGENALYINPTADGICKGILNGLSQKKLSGAVQKNLTTWEISAKELAKTFIGKNDSNI